MGLISSTEEKAMDLNLKIFKSTYSAPRGSGWRGRWEGGSGWGTHVNPWLIHFNVWQNSLQIKKKNCKLCKKKKKEYLQLSPEKAMAPHSSSLAWKIPWMEEPGRLQSMGSWRVRQDWATSLSLFTFMHLRRKWQPTPVFLPGKSQGWGLTESDTTVVT